MRSTLQAFCIFAISTMGTTSFGQEAELHQTIQQFIQNAYKKVASHAHDIYKLQQKMEASEIQKREELQLNRNETEMELQAELKDLRKQANAYLEENQGESINTQMICHLDEKGLHNNNPISHIVYHAHAILPENIPQTQLETALVGTTFPLAHSSSPQNLMPIYLRWSLDLGMQLIDDLHDYKPALFTQQEGCIVDGIHHALSAIFNAPYSIASLSFLDPLEVSRTVQQFWNTLTSLCDNSVWHTYTNNETIFDMLLRTYANPENNKQGYIASLLDSVIEASSSDQFKLRHVHQLLQGTMHYIQQQQRNQQIKLHIPTTADMLSRILEKTHHL